MNQINHGNLPYVQQNQQIQHILRRTNEHVEVIAYNAKGKVQEVYRELTQQKKQKNLLDLCKRSCIKREESFLLNEEQAKILQQTIQQIKVYKNDQDCI